MRKTFIFKKQLMNIKDGKLYFCPKKYIVYYKTLKELDQLPSQGPRVTNGITFLYVDKKLNEHNSVAKVLNVKTNELIYVNLWSLDEEEIEIIS